MVYVSTKSRQSINLKFKIFPRDVVTFMISSGEFELTRLQIFSIFDYKYRRKFTV